MDKNNSKLKRKQKGPMIKKLVLKNKRPKKPTKIKNQASLSESTIFDKNLIIVSFLHIFILQFLLVNMQGPKMAQSHYIMAKTSTPVKTTVIQLSPKKKSKVKLQSGASQSHLEVQNSRSNIDNKNSYKQNTSANFQIVNIPIRIQKPFQKIPKYNNQQVIVRSRTYYNLDSQSKSRRKKIQVTKLQNDASRNSIQVSPYISKFNQQHVANEDF